MNEVRKESLWVKCRKLLALACRVPTTDGFLRRTGALSTIFVLSVTTIAFGQGADTLILGRSTCDQCVIRLHMLARLSSTALMGKANGQAVARTMDNKWILAEPDAHGPLLAFDDRGELIDTIGRFGDGPGEYRRINLIRVTAGDSIRVFDVQTGRLSTYSPNGKFTRSMQVPRPWSASFLSTGHVLLNTVSLDPRFAGFMLFEFDPAGNLVKPWPELHPMSIIRKPWTTLRYLVTDRLGSTWVQHLGYAPIIEHRRSNGTLMSVLYRSAPWYEPYAIDAPIPATSARPPRPIGFGLGNCGRHVVCALWKVADAHWRRGLGPEKRGEGGLPTFPVVSEDDVYDTVLDAIDIRTGLVLASQRFDKVFDGITTEGILVRNSADVTGEPTVELFQVEVSSPTP